jgi:hypothetical protein
MFAGEPPTYFVNVIVCSIGRLISFAFRSMHRRPTAVKSISLPAGK